MATKIYTLFTLGQDFEPQMRAFSTFEKALSAARKFAKEATEEEEDDELVRNLKAGRAGATWKLEDGRAWMWGDWDWFVVMIAESHLDATYSPWERGR